MASKANCDAVLQPEVLEDLRYWARNDRRTLARILDLIEASLRDPIRGVGKPEALQGDLRGCWSRRITAEHRLVYKVSRDRIDFLQARYHYRR